MTVVCDCENCFYNEQGYCGLEKVHISNMACSDNLIVTPKENDNG